MSNKRENRDLLNELGHEESIVYENPDYDSAIIGVSDDDRVIYDFEKMIEWYMEENECDYETAVEFIEYNTLRANPYYPNGPIVMFPLDTYKEEERGKYSFDPKKERERVVQWIRDWFDENGKGCNAVLGLSGGKDSTICAALCVEALGNDRVIGVAMPDMLQGLNDADKIAEHLGIKFMNLPIGNACWHLKKAKDSSGDEFEWSKQTEQNIPPRMRMTMLFAVAQSFNGRVVDTCNYSENYIGYCTIFGDGAGAFSPLGNLTVSEVYAIGDEMGLPYEWVHKTPDDGLPHSSTDEEKFGFTYETLDKYIREGVEPTAEIREKIDKMHAGSEFKRKIVQVPAYEPDIWE